MKKKIVPSVISQKEARFSRYDVIGNLCGIGGGALLVYTCLLIYFFIQKDGSIGRVVFCTNNIDDCKFRALVVLPVSVLLAVVMIVISVKLKKDPDSKRSDGFIIR